MAQTAPQAATLYGPTLVRYIYSRATQMGLDAAAILSVAQQEGGFWGAVGDNGTSYGPFQLHKGGALPPSVADPRTWANSMAGVDYALGQIRDTVGHAKGIAAIQAQVNGFERPAQQLRAGEIQRAAEAYGGIQSDLRSQQYARVSGAGDPRAGGGIGGAISGAVHGGIGDAITSLPVVGPVAGGISTAGGDVTNVAGDIIHGPIDIAHALGWLGGNWDRVLEVAAGFVILIVGVLLLGRHALGRGPNPLSLIQQQRDYSAGVEAGRAYEGERASVKAQKASDRATIRQNQRTPSLASGYDDEIPF